MSRRRVPAFQSQGEKAGGGFQLALFCHFCFSEFILTPVGGSGVGMGCGNAQGKGEGWRERVQPPVEYGGDACGDEDNV